MGGLFASERLESVVRIDRTESQPAELTGFLNAAEGW